MSSHIITKTVGITGVQSSVHPSDTLVSQKVIVGTLKLIEGGLMATGKFCRPQQYLGKGQPIGTDPAQECGAQALNSPGGLTILLFTSSSMALTSSAALGVSELVGRTSNREEA